MISDEGIKQMAEHKSVAVLLPTTAFASGFGLKIDGLCIWRLRQREE